MNSQSEKALSDQELTELFRIKYGEPAAANWSPARRYRWGYYQPGDYYEAMVDKLVKPGTRWIDVGGGRAIFPDNRKLSRILAERCRKVVAVDPSENVFDNPYAHERVQSLFEDFETEDQFDLATFRMVAEHIDNPNAVIDKLTRLLRPDGRVVIYTINKYCPVPLLTLAVPFRWHYGIKKVFWGGQARDTFPVAYKMNTRGTLKELFASRGFEETCFMNLDDLSTFAGFKSLNLVELALWKILRSVGLNYPEFNLLGVYTRVDGEVAAKTSMQGS